MCLRKYMLRLVSKSVLIQQIRSYSKDAYQHLFPYISHITYISLWFLMFPMFQYISVYFKVVLYISLQFRVVCVYIVLFWLHYSLCSSNMSIQVQYYNLCLQMSLRLHVCPIVPYVSIYMGVSEKPRSLPIRDGTYTNVVGAISRFSCMFENHDETYTNVYRTYTKRMSATNSAQHVIQT